MHAASGKSRRDAARRCGCGGGRQPLREFHTRPPKGYPTRFDAMGYAELEAFRRDNGASSSTQVWRDLVTTKRASAALRLERSSTFLEALSRPDLGLYTGDPQLISNPKNTRCTSAYCDGIRGSSLDQTDAIQATSRVQFTGNPPGVDGQRKSGDRLEQEHDRSATKANKPGKPVDK